MESTYRYLPLRNQSAALRRKVTEKALRVFAGWGYQELEVPLIDDFDVLKRGLSSEQVEQALRFLDRSGHVMMLRSDCTPAVAKTLSFQIAKRSGPQRVCYANKVVRIKKGRTKSQLESYKLGVELIGVEGIAAEIEMVCICLEVLRRLDLNDFQINITDHGLVDRILALTGAPIRIRNEVKTAIVARDAFRAASILSNVGVRRRFIETIEVVANIEGGNEQLDWVKNRMGSDPELSSRIERLEQLVDALNKLGFGNYVHIDLASLRSSDYYDGFAFTVVSESVGRSIGGGGRYDELYGAFGKNAPAVGFSMIVDLLCELVYPNVSAESPHTGLSEVVAVSESDLVDGFREVLEKRKAQEKTRVVVLKTGGSRKP